MTLNRNRGCSQPCVLTSMHRLPCTRLLLAKKHLLAVAIGVLGIFCCNVLRRQHGREGDLLWQVLCTYPAIHMQRGHAEHLPVPLKSLGVHSWVPKG